MTDITQGSGDGAGAGGAAEALGVGASPPPPPPFYDGFTDASLKDWAAKAQFKSPEDVAKIAHKFDAIKDQDPANLIAIPGADAKPEAVMAVLDRLGRPKDAADYKLTEIEGADKETAGWFQNVAHEAGLLPWQTQLIAAKQMEFMKQGNDALIAADKAEAEREVAALKSPQGWGADFAAKQESARRAITVAAKQAGVDPKGVIDYLESGAGVGATLKVLAFFGQFIKEGDFVDGAGGTQEPQGLGGGLLASYRATDASMRK